MKTSAAGRAAIAQREGNKLKAYKDSVGIWTIGVGHTAAAGPPAPKAGMIITAKESDEILARDIPKYEKPVNDAVKVPLTQNQFDALVSLAFNIGGGAFAKSTLVKRLNKRDYTGAANAFMSWNKAGGKTLKGLTTRRQAERKQFLNSSTPANKPDIPVIPPIEPKPFITPPAAPQAGTKPDVVLVDGPKQDETTVVVVQHPDNAPASNPMPDSRTGIIALGALIVAGVVGTYHHIVDFVGGLF